MGLKKRNISSRKNQEKRLDCEEENLEGEREGEGESGRVRERERERTRHPLRFEGSIGGRSGSDAMAATGTDAAVKAVEEKLSTEGLSEAAVKAFLYNYGKLTGGESGLIPESDIDAVKELPRLEDLQKESSEVDLKDLLSQTVVLKLNGGLGTSMGLEKAKSLLPVKEGRSFLDLIADQINHLSKENSAKIQFVLMNSFSTNQDTLDALKSTHPEILTQEDLVLLQNKSPKIDAGTLKPVEWKAAPDLEWCPPGHGDIYPSLLGSGMLDRLIGKGFRYAFVSNSDNLGAVMSTDLLAHFVSSGAAFMMEVAERTEADKKGGHLARRKADGQLILRESAMCRDEDKALFQDVSLHKYFNTNNLWLDFVQLKKKMEEYDGIVPLPLIKNKKTVNPMENDNGKQSIPKRGIPEKLLQQIILVISMVVVVITKILLCKG